MTTRSAGQARLPVHISRIAAVIGIVLVGVALFLPFVISDAGDQDAVAADVIPGAILLVPILVLVLIPDWFRPLPRLPAWIALVLGTASLTLAVVKYSDAVTTARTLDGRVGLGSRMLVFGAFLVVVGVVTGLVDGMLMRRSARRSAARPPQRPVRPPRATPRQQGAAHQQPPPAPPPHLSQQPSRSTRPPPSPPAPGP